MVLSCAETPNVSFVVESLERVSEILLNTLQVGPGGAGVCAADGAPAVQLAQDG